MVDALEVMVPKKAFVKALSHMQFVSVGAQSTNVLLTAKGSHLELMATDLDIIACERIEAQVISPGQVSANAAMLFEITKKLADSIFLKFNPSSSTLRIDAKECTCNLATSLVQDFPQLDDLQYESTFKVDAAVLAELLNRCKFAVYQEENRHSFNGVFMHSTEEQVKCVATDGHRLSIASSNKAKGLADFKGVVIPQRTVVEVVKILDEVQGEVEVSVNNNKIRFVGPSFTLTSRLVATQFPDYANLVPKECTLSIEIPKQSFATALDRVSSINSDKFKGAKLVLKDDLLSLSANNENGSSVVDSIRVISDKSAQFEVGVNARYILDVLNVIKGNSICFDFKDPFSPIVIREKGDDTFTYIIMPMRVFG
jgi:DNA polymerase-3 subunit beta